MHTSQGLTQQEDHAPYVVKIPSVATLFTADMPNDAVLETLHFCVGDLGEGLDIAASTLSHHLKELNRAGLVRMERRGKHIECWLEPEVLGELARFFRQTGE